MPLRISVSWSRPATDTPTETEHDEPEPVLEPLTPIADTVLYDVATQRLFEQMTRHDALDAKAATAFSFGGTVLPITFGLLSISDRDLPRCYLFLPLLYAAAGSFLLVLIFSIATYLIRKLSLRPHLPTLQTHCETLGNDVMRRWTTNEYLRSIDANEKKLTRKALFVGLALLFSICEAVLLTLAAFTTL